MRQQLQYPENRAIFERTVVDSRMHNGPIISQWGTLFEGFWTAFQSEHAAFDAQDASTPVIEQAIGCAFDWELGPED
jgi:hypothetical protein